MLAHIPRGAFVACSVAIFIAGCAGSQSLTGGQTVSLGELDHTRPLAQATGLPARPNKHAGAGWFSTTSRLRHGFPPAAQNLYVANQSNNEIDIYLEAGRFTTRVGEIAAGIDGPYGLYVDREHALYVANQKNNTVTKYPYGATSPSLTYSAKLSRPLYPLVDRRGDLFVSNANNGTVVEYLAGTTTSAYQIIQTAGRGADGMDFDQHGNLYVACRNGAGLGSIEEFSQGSTQGTVLGMTLNQPQGVIVDTNGNILAVETGPTRRVDVFAPGAQTPSLQEDTTHIGTQLALAKSQVEIFLSTLSGIVYVAPFPLRGLKPYGYVKDQSASLIQVVTITDSQF
jgi:DNA-binding beta-propeller fold protein YncE